MLIFIINPSVYTCRPSLLVVISLSGYHRLSQLLQKKSLGIIYQLILQTIQGKYLIQLLYLGTVSYICMLVISCAIFHRLYLMYAIPLPLLFDNVVRNFPSPFISIVLSSQHHQLLSFSQVLIGQMKHFIERNERLRFVCPQCRENGCFQVWANAKQKSKYKFVMSINHH